MENKKTMKCKQVNTTVATFKCGFAAVQKSNNNGEIHMN